MIKIRVVGYQLRVAGYTDERYDRTPRPSALVTRDAICVTRNPLNETCNSN